MSHFVADLVGFTDNRAKDRIAHASVTRAGIVNSIVNTLTTVGWTVLSGPTPNGIGDVYELYSQQVPWYDHDNPPAWYLGGRVYLKIEHPNGSAISFRFGEFYNGAATEISSGVISITIAAYAANSGDFFVFANPYSCYTGIHLSTAPSGTEFFCSALLVPEPIQEDQQIISSIIADRLRISSTMVGSTQVYSCWRTNTGVTSWYGNPNNPSTFLTVKGATDGSLQYRSGRRMWRRDKDPGQTNAQVWTPYPLPAQIALPITGINGTQTWRGFIPDALIIADNATQGSYIDFISKSWYCYGSGNSATDNYPGSLWINLGPSGTFL